MRRSQALATVASPNFSCEINISEPKPNITTACEFGLLGMVENTGMFKRSLYRFEEERFTKKQVFDFVSGTMNGTKIRYLAPFEIVDAHQWEGHPPAEIKTKQGVTIDTQPAMWDIASADTASGERVLLIRTHSKRDDVFKITTRLNMIREYCMTILKPFQADLEADGQIDPDEIRKFLEESPPDFGWI